MMDLETFNKDGILTPYAVSYYDGKYKNPST